MRMKSMEIIKKILAQMFPEVDIMKNAKNFVSQTKKTVPIDDEILLPIKIVFHIFSDDRDFCLLLLSCVSHLFTLTFRKLALDGALEIRCLRHLYVILKTNFLLLYLQLRYR